MVRQKYIVTGGFGFIGTQVTAYLVAHAADVTVWDLQTGDNIMKPQKLIDEYMKKGRYDALVHLAAQLEILNVNPIPEIDLNIKGTVNMLEIARKFDIPKFIYASSADVYGEPKQLPTPETHPCQPMWSYGSSKAASEVYVRQYEELYGIKTVIIRPSIVTGIYEWYGRFITLSLARIRMGEPILVFGDGNQTRDFINVGDVARMFAWATVADIKTPEILNCGSGIAQKITTIAKFLSKTNNNHPIKYVNPKVGELGRKPHEQIHQHLDIKHALYNLGWVPQVSLANTIRQMNDWILKMSDKEFESWIKRPRY